MRKQKKHLSCLGQTEIHQHDGKKSVLTSYWGPLLLLVVLLLNSLVTLFDGGLLFDTIK